MANIRSGYSLEKNRCENIALADYFFVQEKIVEAIELRQLLNIETNHPLILIASNLSLYTFLIEQSKRPVIIFHMSDEAYDVSKANIYKHRNVQLVFRNYNIFPLSTLLESLLKWPIVCLRWIFTYWCSSSSLINNLNHVKHILLSKRYLFRQIRFAWLIKAITNKIIYFPLNETNFYYEAAVLVPQKNYQVSFVGSLHSSERIGAHSIAGVMGYAHGYDGWGWRSAKSLTANDYVEVLKKSKYSLCPTGHINLDCFRFYEIIKSGSLPLVPKETPFQPFNYYSKLYDLDQRISIDLYTKKQIQKTINSISDDDYEIILNRLKSSIELKNRAVKDLLKKYCPEII